MHKNLLQNLGLSSSEADVYLYLLENPQQTITDIAKETNINRPKLYNILPNMEEQGLVTKTLVGKRNFYIAENPKILKNYLHSIEKNYHTFIPELSSLYSNSFSKPVIKNVTGKTGIKHIFIDVANTLNKGDVFYRYSSRIDVNKTSIDQKDYNIYKNLREEKQLQRMVITNAYLQGLKEKKLDKEVVIIPKNFDLFEDNITKIIYANKVAIIDYNTKVSFIIESEVFANFEKKIFLLLFRFLKKIPST